MKTEWFDYEYRCAGLTDIGAWRKSNQDEFVLAPELGIFAISDGMGGLEKGGVASAYVKQALPVVAETYAELWRGANADTAAAYLRDSVRLLSDRLFAQGNSSGWIRYGATLAAVLLYGGKAIFVCLGDSRGYLLPKFKKDLVQITEDMNVAGVLGRSGEMTKEQAAGSPESSRLTAYVGMPAPAEPETFIVDVRPGDRILLCSDGLYGMVPEREIARIIRASRSPERVCQKLIDRANANGGHDNISAVYIQLV